MGKEMEATITFGMEELIPAAVPLPPLIVIPRHDCFMLSLPTIGVFRDPHKRIIKDHHSGFYRNYIQTLPGALSENWTGIQQKGCCTCVSNI